MMITPRWYQSESLDAIWNYYQSGNSGNCLVALPTGTGKSIIPALFIKGIMQQWPTQRFMLMTHVRKLIEQNAEKLLQVWPNAPLGIYSAGLRRKEAHLPIVFGGNKSIVNNIDAFGHRDIVFVDEAHLISPDEGTTYQKILDRLIRINPHLKVIGLTATYYRLKQGLLTEDGLFNDIVYDMTNVDGFRRLIAEGFLAPLMARPTETRIDVDGVGIVAGEFNQAQLEEVTNQDKVTLAALEEALHLSQGRKCGMIFAHSIAHAERIAYFLEEMFHESCVVLHSKVGKSTQETNAKNERSFKLWYEGFARIAVSKDMLTTGVDVPHVDFIIDLAATLSPGLHVQKCGRGTRPAPEKNNCLFLDFAGNTERLGPIDNPRIPNPRKKGEPGEMPVRICDACGCYNHASARICAYCGHAFEIKVKIKEQASEAPVMLSAEAPKIELFKVEHAIYNRHNKENKPPSMRVTYFCEDAKRFDEWICFEHPTGSFPRKRAIDWWRRRHETETPETVDGALRYISELRMPKRIRVWTNKHYPEVMNYEY